MSRKTFPNFQIPLQFQRKTRLTENIVNVHSEMERASKFQSSLKTVVTSNIVILMLKILKRS